MAYRFKDYWLIETLRLRETLWGPLEDSAESGRARASGGNFRHRLVTRFRLLAQRERIDENIDQWFHAGRLMFVLFAVVAVLAGVGAATGALGGGDRPVNLVFAIAALLGLNTFTLLLWAMSFGIRGDTRVSLLADAWLGLTRRLARGPNAALLPRALLELLTRQRLARWSASVLSHAVWSLALLGALAALLALLAARRYAFQWETTLLSPDTFVTVVRVLGWLPARLGFPQPSEAIVRASGDPVALSAEANALWSGWLLGVVVVYGLLPRIAALIVSAWVLRHRFARMTIDPTLPGLAELHDRLMPASESTGIDTPAPPLATEHVQRSPLDSRSMQRCLLGLELPPDLHWPPGPLPTDVADLGVVDTRDQRRRILDELRRIPAERLLVYCDARQTPDRGAIAVLTELTSLSGMMRIVLLPDETSVRKAQWRSKLLHAGFKPEQIEPSAAAGLQWLAEHTDSPRTSGDSP